MTRLLVTIAALTAIIIAAAGSPDRTTRRGLRPLPDKGLTRQTTREGHDTVTPSPGMIGVSGYDKPLRSAKETLLITNRSSRTLISAQLRITYLDAHGRQLHEATIWLDTDIPPGETRQLKFKSWDVQRTFYYRLTGRPRRSDGTLYDVSICPLRAVYATAGDKIKITEQDPSNTTPK